MMLPRIFLVLFGLLVINPLHASAQWTNEPSGSTQVLDCNFSSPPGACGITDVYASSIPDTDGTAPVSPSGVLRSTISAGNNTGGMQIGITFPQTYREMYVGLMWRTNPQFEGRLVGNKLFFVRGPGMNGVFLFGADRLTNGSNSMIFGTNTGGVDNSHACSSGGLLCYPNAGPGTLTVGVWTKLEAYVKSSTTATSRDGIVRWWVNGVLAGNYTNMNYGWSGLNDWTWSETWDGFVNPVPSVDWSHYIDHLHVSIPNCISTSNCGGGTIDIPSGPPGAVTGFTATVGGVQ